MATNNTTPKTQAPSPAPTTAKQAPAAAPDTYTTPQGIFPGKPQIAYPDTPGFKPAQPVAVGGTILASGDITYNAHRPVTSLKVRNTGDRPIQVGSHFHFFEVNRYLEFDRPSAYGCHLNIPATTAIRFEPGEEKEVEVVPFAGKQRVIGFNDLADGFAGAEDSPVYYPNKARAIRRMEAEGFKSAEEKQ